MSKVKKLETKVNEIESKKLVITQNYYDENYGILTNWEKFSLVEAVTALIDFMGVELERTQSAIVVKKKKK